MSGLIEINNLEVSIDKHKILRGIDLTVPERQILAVIGPSGCGKTTLLRTINKLIGTENGGSVSGEIFFKGENINNFSLDELRTKIGIVFQKPMPFPASIYKNLTYALKYHGIKNKKRLDAIVEDKLRLCGLYSEVKDDLHMSALKLSGGQQQRLCIARALCVEPEVILLDEPCSALDIHNTKLIEDLMKKLAEKYAIIIVTHNLQQAKRVADMTAFLLEGKLIEVNKTEVLFCEPEQEETKHYLQGLYG